MVSENSKAGQEGLVGSIGLTVPLSREDPADLESHFQGALIEGWTASTTATSHDTQAAQKQLVRQRER